MESETKPVTEAAAADPVAFTIHFTDPAIPSREFWATPATIGRLADEWSLYAPDRPRRNAFPVFSGPARKPTMLMLDFAQVRYIS